MPLSTRFTDNSDTELKLSADGYLRIPMKQLLSIPLSHLFSQLGDWHNTTPNKESSVTEICGFTEWVSDTIPAISISWDWSLQTSSPPPRYAISGEPFSNLMLISEGGEDLGPLVTNHYLLKLINKLGWENETAQSINTIH